MLSGTNKKKKDDRILFSWFLFFKFLLWIFVWIDDKYLPIWVYKKSTLTKFAFFPYADFRGWIFFFSYDP
jgi:hypothetical protein